MPRTVLIVDDNAINRSILSKILSADYAVLEAENGQEAMAVLLREYQRVSAVLLDIVMPVMDGHAVLEQMQGNPLLSQIPVIVTTGTTDLETERLALKQGANDFISKPFDADVLRRRLDNLIRLRETSAMVNTYQKDGLTGLWNRDSFMEKAAGAIGRQPAGYYYLSSVDIDNFKIINDQYGTEKGDEVLRRLAKVLSDDCAVTGGICGRISADNFIVLFPRHSENSSDEARRAREAMMIGGLNMPVTLSMGRYIVEDRSLSVSAMYDRAKIARDTVKGRYDTHIAVYDESMRSHIVREQEITNEMNTALATGQFEAWYQPQYNHANGALIGAEALARWRHPEHGMISPGEFIPVFERNGFVYELDKFIWEEVCKALRHWLDEGREPLPVSVNISRYDLFRDDLVGVIAALTEKYAVPAELLRLEVTESAFAKSTAHVVEVIEQLIERGFTVEIDDFGSGYSSLNTLKSVPAQIVKLDMRFLEGDGTDRGGNILESIIRMAKWIGMSVIAEGVESAAQADFLKSVGCNYVQGYLYARPMPVESYDALARGTAKEEKLIAMETVENLDNNAFWNPESMDTLIFNSYVGAACIFEYHNGRIELIRSTGKFADMVTGGAMSVADTLKLEWSAYLDAENNRLIAETIRRSMETQDEVTSEFVFTGLPGCPAKTYIRASFRVIATTGDRCLVYNLVENITPRREASERISELNDTMRTLMDDTPGGFVRRRLMPDGSSVPVYFNDGFCKLVGMSRGEVESAESAMMQRIHPDDREAVRENISAACLTDKATAALKYRLLCGDGEYHWFSVFVRETHDDKGDTFLNMYYAELPTSEQKELSVRETMPFVLSAIMEASNDYAFAKDRDFRYLCCSPAFLKLAGLTDESEARGKTDFDLFPRDMAEQFRRNDIELFEGGAPLVDYDETLRGEDWVQYCRASKHILRDSTGEIIGLYGVSRDISSEREMELNNNELALRLSAIMDSIDGGVSATVVKDGVLHYVFTSDRYYEMLGYTREQFARELENGMMSAIHPADRAMVLETVARVEETGKAVMIEFRIAHRDGHMLWLRSRSSLCRLKDVDGLVHISVLFDITAQKEADEAVRIRETEYRLAIEGSDKYIYRYNHIDDSVDITGSAAPIFGVSGHVTDVPESLIKSSSITEDSAETYREFYRAIRRGDPTGSMTIRRNAAGKGLRWYSGYFRNVFDDDGTPISAIIVYGDVTEQREKEAAYTRWQQSLEERAPESYTLYRWNLSKNAMIGEMEGRLLYFRSGVSYPSFGERTVDFVEKYVYQKDRERYAAVVNADAMLANYYRGSRLDTLEYRGLMPDGQMLWIRLTIEMVEYPNSSDVCAYMMYENIDEAKREELLMREQAETDPLTGVLNRATFTDRFDALLRGGQPCALLMLDIDGFKLLNDTFGHAAGDDALIEIAEALRSILRPTDLLGRLGGDEFIIGISDIETDSAVGHKAGQVCALLRRAYSPEVQISVSIGIALSPRDGSDFDAVYRKADVALYMAKDSGRDNFAFFEPWMASDDMKRRAHDEIAAETPARSLPMKRRLLIVEDNPMDAEVLAGMFSGAFTVIRAKSGAEALVRLRHYGTAISAVLLDLFMPNIDGFEVLKKMRESEELRSVPVIAVSGSSDLDTTMRAIRNGAVDFVTKPVDPDIINVRVHSAISKAEVERLRAQNSYLSMQNAELAKYRAALGDAGMTVIEQNWKDGSFTYDPAISEHIAGKYDSRKLAGIFLADSVADVKDVQRMQKLVHGVANDRERMSGGITVRLKTPSGAKHSFRMKVIKLTDEFGLADRLIISFTDLDAGTADEK